MSCESGKTEWASERAAKRFLRTLVNPQGRMHAYRCGDHWHIGHRDRIDVDRGKR